MSQAMEKQMSSKHQDSQPSRELSSKMKMAAQEGANKLVEAMSHIEGFEPEDAQKARDAFTKVFYNNLAQALRR